MFKESPELLSISRRWYKAMITRNEAELKNYLSETSELRFVGSADGTLYVVSYPELAMIKKIKLADKSIRSVAINETLGELAVGLSDNSIRILDIDGQKQKYKINAHKLSVEARLNYMGQNTASLPRFCWIQRRPVGGTKDRYSKSDNCSPSPEL